MDWKILMLLVVYLIKTVDRVDGSCSLSLKNDFGSPSPVYLHNSGFLTPNADGAILLRRSETLQVACPGDKKYVVLNNNNGTTAFDLVDVKCVSNTTFRASKIAWVGAFKDIRCNDRPWFLAEKTNATCSAGYIYRVGYKIRTEFYKLYEACFDKGSLTTRFVKHELLPTSFINQIERRPSFIEGDMFPKVRMSELYKVSQQRDRLETLLGPGNGDKYVTKKQFLNRGHLAANADFSMLAARRATFHYINTAPQWNRGNAGDWAALEEALRRRLKTYNSSVTVYTGTHGVSTLEDHTGRQQELFLHTDENNNGVVPVPLYFYKLVYDPRRKLSAAFISINSLYYDTNTTDKLTFCNDICGENRNYKWLKWRANDATTSFCCEYKEFVKEINGLPKLDVRGLFY